MRVPLSKKKRFDVFKRDSFTCQYCGATPPTVTLEVDHIHPIAQGGIDDIDNLVTACFNCNRGKAASLLSDVPQSLKSRAEDIQEHEEQIRGYSAVLMARAARINNDAWDVAGVIEGEAWIEDVSKDDLQSIKRFLSKLPTHDVMEAAEIAHRKDFSNSRKRFSYFCGVCWNKIRESEHATR